MFGLTETMRMDRHVENRLDTLELNRSQCSQRRETLGSSCRMSSTSRLRAERGRKAGRRRQVLNLKFDATRVYPGEGPAWIWDQHEKLPSIVQWIKACGLKVAAHNTSKIFTWAVWMNTTPAGFTCQQVKTGKNLNGRGGAPKG